MFRRLGLILLMNAAILIVANIFLFILSLFGINVDSNGYLWLFIFCMIASFVGSGISLYLSKWLAKRAYNIVLIDQTNVHKLDSKERIVYDTVKNLSEKFNIKMPEVGIYKDAEANAFATGATKNSSLVAASTGLLDLMDEDAIEGVIGHEMAHVINGDMVTMTIMQGILDTFVLFFAKVIAGIVEGVVDEKYAWIARFVVDIILQIIFGFLASFITMWFSRVREYKADAGSAQFVGKEKMIAGLEALKRMQSGLHEANKSYATMKISTPKEEGILSRLLSSHPSLDDRIKALEDLRIS